MVNETIKITKTVLGKYQDYKQCEYCDDMIHIDDNYFILYCEEYHLDCAICSDICLDSAVEFIEKKSINSIKEAIIRLANDPENYKRYALNNRDCSESFTKDLFIRNMKGMFEEVLKKTPNNS